MTLDVKRASWFSEHADSTASNRVYFYSIYSTISFAFVGKLYCLHVIFNVLCIRPMVPVVQDGGCQPF